MYWNMPLYFWGKVFSCQSKQDSPEMHSDILEVIIHKPLVMLPTGTTLLLGKYEMQINLQSSLWKRVLFYYSFQTSSSGSKKSKRGAPGWFSTWTILVHGELCAMYNFISLSCPNLGSLIQLIPGFLYRCLRKKKHVCLSQHFGIQFILLLTCFILSVLHQTCFLPWWFSCLCGES